MRPLLSWIGLICWIIGCTALPAAAAPDPDAARIAAVVDPLIARELKASGAPGAGVVVVRGGRVVFIRGYGAADREAGMASGPDTVWPIASITKVLTSIGAMQQVERGRLRLDADLNSELGGLRIPDGFGQPITLAEALSHTSGLDELPGRRLESPPPPGPLSRFLQGRLVRYRAPGAFTSYSTYGIAVTGAAIENVSGEAYPDYVRRHIFQPVGAASSRIMVRLEDSRGIAAPYALEDGQAKRIAYEWYATPPTSSAVLSLRDMGRLMADLTSPRPRLLKRATLDLMMAQHSTLHPAVPGWGYGFQLDRANGRRIAEHGGDIGGFASLLSFLPDEGLAIFTVNHGEGSSLRFKVRKAVLDALYPAPPFSPPPAVTTDLKPYLGLYRASFQCHSCKEPSAVPEFEVTADGAGSLELWGSHWRPVGGDVFVDPDDGRRLAFVRDGDGRVVALSGGAWRVGERVADANP
jgi:CubicO group peptidase (beta-lactamase class C family)